MNEKQKNIDVFSPTREVLYVAIPTHSLSAGIRRFGLIFGRSSVMWAFFSASVCDTLGDSKSSCFIIVSVVFFFFPKMRNIFVGVGYPYVCTGLTFDSVTLCSGLTPGGNWHSHVLLSMKQMGRAPRGRSWLETSIYLLWSRPGPSHYLF